MTSLIINHEVPIEHNKAIIAEAYRLTRAGGYYYPIDFKSSGETGTAYAQYRSWWDHRWNCEQWSPEFRASDFEGEIERAGFTINHDTACSSASLWRPARGEENLISVSVDASYLTLF